MDKKLMAEKFRTEHKPTQSLAQGAFNLEDSTEFLLGHIHSEKKGMGGGKRVLKALEKLAKEHGAKVMHAVLGSYEDTDFEKP